MGLALGAAVAAGLRGGDARFDLAQPGVAIDHIVHSRAVYRRGFLRHVRDTPLRGHEDIAAIRVQLAPQHAEQRGLAAAVGADKADALARVERHAGVVEQHLGAALED
ncbi:hypothetical protein D3C86_1321900 [compost metagenome]